ncbi:MAG: hypothetical protein DWP95_13395 [Proteobacteria bacterium]|nr:MAG: hypothetical protein DWP95_13395 [Pseudomonadota bacterium]
MQVQVNHDHNIVGGESLQNYVENLLADALHNFRDQITRVEVHVSDENADKGGENDLRCTMEVRIRGMQPFAVTHRDKNIHAAIDGAADRLTRWVRKTVQKRREA